MEPISRRSDSCSFSRVFAAPLKSSSTVRKVIKTIYSTYGVAGFYRGLALSIVRAIPSNACAYFVYETLLRKLGAEKVCLFAPRLIDPSSHTCYADADLSIS